MRLLQVRSALLLGTLALLLTGCGRDPVSPQVTLPGQPDASGFGGTQTEDPEPPVHGQPGASTVLFVSANGEGSARVGRFAVKIHKNPLRNPATITLSVTDRDAMQVDIQVSPPEANDFQVPIELTADFSDRPDLNLNNQTVFWWNDEWRAADNVTVKQGDRQLKVRTHRLAGAKIGERVPASLGREME